MIMRSVVHLEKSSESNHIFQLLVFMPLRRMPGFMLWQVVVMALLASLLHLIHQRFISSFPVHHQGIIIITGASSGIGRHAAEHLARKGYHVLAGVRRDDDFNEIETRRFTGHCPHLYALKLEVTSNESIQAAAEEVRRIMTSTDLPLVALVNNAGIGGGLAIEMESLANVRAVFEVNVFGVLATTQAFLPMLRSSRGRIVMVSSTAGFLCGPMFGIYCASKHALEGISDALRMEVAGQGISVSIIQPGYVNTNFITAASNRLEVIGSNEAHSLYEDALRKYQV